MLERAESNNARLRQAYPGGFALDADHRPHITLLQCFVAVKDLEALASATGDVIRNAKVTDLLLRADRYYYTPGPGVGVAGICAEPTPELLRLQADVIAAAAPFMAPTGPIEAFTAGHDNPAFDTALIDYVSGFVGTSRRRALQSARQHRRRADRLSRPDDRRTVRGVRLCSGRRRRVPVGAVRHGGAAPQALGRDGVNAEPLNPALSAWRDGAPKQAILDFVARVTTAGHPDFVPAADRIAVFDNDGTLWVEQPLPVQAYFVVDRIRALAPQHPEWRDRQPFKAVLEGDVRASWPWAWTGSSSW